MTDSADLLALGVAVSLILAGLGRLRGRSPASWDSFPLLSAALFLASFVFAQLDAHRGAAPSGTANEWLASPGASALLYAIIVLTIPVIMLYPLRRQAAGVGVVFLLLFAFDAAEQWGLSIAGTAIARPLGYSYLLFRLYDALRNPLSDWRASVLRVTAFPTLPTGPILMHGQTRTIARPLTLRSPFYQRAIFLLALGIVKLYVFLPLTQIYLETGLILPLQPSLFTLINASQAAFYSYLRLFLDFSGYTDLVVAMCGFMGFKIRHNFLRPYAAVSLRDFWRRWHITLAGFMRRHVYIPLGGRQTSFPRYTANIVVVFALLGLWHGLSLHFLLWGLLHAAYLLFEVRLLAPAVQKLSDRGGALRRCAHFSQYLLTQTFVAFSWLVFFFGE